MSIRRRLGQATLRYSGRVGWEEPTTSTDYMDTGYWSVYTVNTFNYATRNTNYLNYTDYDMQQLLARVNDKTENPDRPWVVEDVRNGRRQWVYYGNYDWYHMMFREKHRTMCQTAVELRTSSTMYPEDSIGRRVFLRKILIFSVNTIFVLRLISVSINMPLSQIILRSIHLSMNSRATAG